ncbi:hypothetical protein ABFX02_08G195800 [Erythranthe guttata]
MLHLCRRVAFQILIVAFITLSLYSRCPFTEARISEFSNIEDVGYVVHRRIDKEDRYGGSYPAPKPNPNSDMNNKGSGY